MALPILVVGRNRSGTKWLTNIIAAHPQVACIQHARHTGVLETNLLLQHPAIYGDLRKDENFVAFISTFAQEDFFKLSGLDPSILLGAPRDWDAFFRWYMDRVAEKAGARAWVQKTSTVVLDHLLATMPDARFVLISREVEDNVRSNVAIQGGMHRGGVVRELFRYYAENARIRRVGDDPRCLVLTYEELKADSEGTARRVCAHVGLDFDPAMLRSPWEVNSSWTRVERSKDEVLPPEALARLRRWEPVMRAIPPEAYEALYRGRLRLVGWSFLRHPEMERFMPESFHLRREELGLEVPPLGKKPGPTS